MIDWLYSHAACMATAPQPGFHKVCPSDGAMLAVLLALLAFGILVLVYAADDGIRFYREHKREERLRRLRG